MSYESDKKAEEEFYRGLREWQKKQAKKKTGNASATIGKRTVRYVAPGHTIVYYKNRTLHVYFRESKAEFDKKRKLRAKARRSSRTPQARSRSEDEVYIDWDQYGNMIYVDGKGRDVTYSYMARMERGRNEMARSGAKNDKYSLEDMRAILKDERWDEVSGNKRWNYDSAATVKEFKKYLRTHQHRT